MSTPSTPSAQFAKRLGSVLKGLRQRQRLTQATVAELLGDGVATETVSRFERGAVVPSLPWLERLAELYGTSIDGVYAAALEAPPPADPHRTELWEFVQGLGRDQSMVVLALGRAYVAATRGTEPGRA